MTNTLYTIGYEETSAESFLKKLESAGVKDILTKSLGSKNAANVVKATLNALLSLRTREAIYKARGLEFKKVMTPKAPDSVSA